MQHPKSQSPPKPNPWRTCQQISYSTDLATWSMVEGTFKANKDTKTAVGHILAPSIRCRFIRFMPVAWNQHIAMRAEVYGKTAAGADAERR